MRTPLCLACLLVISAFAIALPPAVPAAWAVANHVVIGELCTGGSSATDEFVELYNPTESAIDISGWKLQYKSATGITWYDRGTLPANTYIAAHGFYLIVPPAYVGPPSGDFVSAAWSSGMAAAGGHERIIDGSSAQVDMVGWGTANAPEGGSAAPAHSLGNSIERKANATSTMDSLAAGGRHELLGNGQDTDVNGNDFVNQTHGRRPQNSTNAPEPAFAAGGNGTGRAAASPAIVYTGKDLTALEIAFAQDSSYTITNIAILVPSTWTWSHWNSSVTLTGAAFVGATHSVLGDTIFIAQAALTTADSGKVTIDDLVTPSTKGNSIFTTRTAVSGGTLTSLLAHPRVRVLDLVPIVVVHVNNPTTGVAIAPYAVGSEATVTGTVTVNFNDIKTDLYLQDGTAGINLYSASLPPFTIAIGDSLTVTGSILQFRGLTELQPDNTLLTRHATGRPLPEPMVLTCADVNATFHPDGTEPNEARLVRINGVTYNSVTSTITDASGTTNIFIPVSWPPAPSVFDVIGILKQYKPGTPAPGPPYTADYEVSPRTPSDIIPHAGPIILTTPYENNIQPTSVQVHWTTDVASTSIVPYGLTTALGDTLVDANPVTTHDVTIPGLTPATVHYYTVGSKDVNGTNFSTTRVFCTASPPQTTGEINAYFNKSVETSLARIHEAHGNEDLPARLTTRIDNARRSIDAAIYSMSGTPGSTIANALISAKNRGIKVRVICEYDNQGTSPFSSLVAAGIPLINDRFDAINNGLGLMHNKFFLIDGRAGAPESVWVWTGSWNLTDPGTNDDCQNSIEIQDQALAVVYTLEFNEMWGSATDVPNASVSRFGARKLDDTPHKFVIGGHDAACYFSPSDGANWQIISAINAAQHTIGFEVLTLTRDDIAAALVARKTAGLKVRGDLDNGTDTGSQYSYLLGAGVDVRLKTGSGLLHHKYAIFDGENPRWDPVTLTGSHNWSSAAENSNNENTFIIHDFDIANQYLQEFAARYYQFGGVDSVLLVAVGPIPGVPAGTVHLAQNFPNPAPGRTSISYAIPSRQQVVLRLYDISGRVVRTLVNQVQTPGTYRVDFKAGALESGVYFYRLETGGRSLQRKMLLLK